MELVNKIDEKELFAARSTADAAGNNIADTYAKKTEIPDVSDFVTQQELSTELNTKQDNLSTEQLYNIDNAVTSLAGVMAESKLTIEDGKITEYDGTPFAGGSSGQSYTSPNETITVDNTNGTLEATKYCMDNERSVSDTWWVYEDTEWDEHSKSRLPWGLDIYPVALEAGTSVRIKIAYNSGVLRLKWGTDLNFDNVNVLGMYTINFGATGAYSFTMDEDGYYVLDPAICAAFAAAGVKYLTIRDSLGQQTGVSGALMDFDIIKEASVKKELQTKLTGVAPIIVDNDNDTISADTVEVNYQQIVHDDSLVHVSNDAQYALGVNTKMFPCDETVLWEGSSNLKDIPTFNLSESFKNFEYIEIYGKGYTTHAEVSYLKFSSANFAEGVTIYMPYKGGGSVLRFGVAFIESSSDTVLNIQTGSAFQITIQSGSSVTATPQGIITKIVGIGRKGGN